MTNQQPYEGPSPALSIYVNFDGNCQEAFDAYRGVFGGEFSNMMTFADLPPDDDSPPMPEGWDGKIMHVALPIGDGVLMGSDMPPGFGPPLAAGNNFSVSYAAPTRDEANRVFAALADGGEVTMDLQDMFWGDYFGTCTDRFGINWQVHHTVAEGADG